MKLENVQQYVADRIMAVPALAAFGAPIQYTPFLDDDALKTAIGDQLRVKGVCIEIGQEEADRVDDPMIRGVAADASFDVFVSEAIKTAHAPSDKMLRKAVIDAVTVRLDARETPAKFLRSDTAKAEQGYVLHILSFTIRVTIP